MKFEKVYLLPRIYLVLAAFLWSFGGAFTKMISQPENRFSWLGLADQPVHPMYIALGRTASCAILLACFLRPGIWRFQWGMVITGICFALMSATYVTAMVWGSAAHAVLLQYTAPFWLIAGSFFVFGDRTHFKEVICLIIGVIGVAIIVLGPSDQASESRWEANGLALISGFFFAAVLIGLRLLKGISPLVLTWFNMALASILLVPLAWNHPLPSVGQMVFLFIFGVLQLGVPYLLTAKGLKVIKPTEAGLITLLEPFLNPFWAWAVCPKTESLDGFTALGGAFILGALALRYLPWGRSFSAKPSGLGPNSTGNQSNPGQ